jgi:hypothetical protein
LIRAPLSISSVLDEAAETVALTAAPWMGVLVAASLPYRFAQVLFFDRLFEVGKEASSYRNLLGDTANLVMLCFALSLVGRAIYARACRIAMVRGTRPGREAWRVPPAALASYFLTGSASVVLFFSMLFTIVGTIVAVIVSGLAIGTMELNERVGLLRPFKLMGRNSRALAVLVGMAVIFFCALFVAWINLVAGFGIGSWLLDAAGIIEAPAWTVLFSMKNRLFLLLTFFGALSVVEPFWIAAHVVYVRKAGAQESGDDLRDWFQELRRAS